ncbi:MAG: FG-GAP repeat protein [Calditrichaeota bacterium]|nr:FG-GAP repeat protein [Calditrichota bacterium]MCB9391572.1 FG-GAP repeat protein [Calditrichota bacterium]
MKRIGYVLLTSVAVLVIYALSLAQLESRNAAAKYLLRVMDGEAPRAYYGSAVEGAYAWTGGNALYAVSQTGENAGPVARGAVYIYDGLLAESPTLTIRGQEDGDLFGSSLSSGDFNGDGTPDLAIAAEGGQGTGAKPAGKVYLYLGGSSFGSNGLMVTAGDSKDSFGRSISLQHDVNGDQYADLVIGAPHSARAGATSGRAYIWYGNAEGKLGKSPDVEIKLGTLNDLFGSSVATGDITGDGQADIAIGSPHYGTEATYSGAVYVFQGGSGLNVTKPTKLYKGELTSFQDQFGWSVAIVPDQNGDGTSELVVGAPQFTSSGRQLGKVYVYHGAATLPDAPSGTFVGTAEAGRYGEKVFSLGDVNKDGKGDWAAQAANASQSRGVVYFYYGGWENDFYQFTGEAIADVAGNSVAMLGDLDGNGAMDLAVGARWWDRDLDENVGRVYLLSIQ